MQSLHCLPRAPDDDGLRSRLAGRRPAVILNYDGVLTPIVGRPEDAVISDGMRATVWALARRCPDGSPVAVAGSAWPSRARSRRRATS